MYNLQKQKLYFLSLLFFSFSFVSKAQQTEIDSLEVLRLKAYFTDFQLAQGIVVPPSIPDYRVELIGSDNKAVVGVDRFVYRPLVSKSVNLLFKVTRKEDNSFIEIPATNIVVEGKYKNNGVGNKPFVIPSLREWYGTGGDFILAKRPRIAIKSNDLKEVAQLLKEDLKKLLNIEATLHLGVPKSGDIYLIKSKDNSLGEEGYALKIDNVFQIASPTYKGSVFGTRTLLQLLEQSPQKLNIPRGESRDYPTYEVRGFMLDVGRKFFTIDFLNKYVEFMSYYKMSNFQIHLNDNAFHKYFGFDWDKTPSGFRLENSTYPGLASSDGHYTKKEFITLQEKAIRYGITIIPEIDVPAHSLAIVKAVPEIGSEKYGKDHLDLSNPKTREVVENIFKEYISGPNPVFIGKEVHIGTDEYDKSEAEAFRSFTDFVIKLVQKEGKDVRAWGALTHAQGNTLVTVDNVTLNMWYNGYAEPLEMKKLGYKQISTPDDWLYIVPAAGYYYDYLNTDNLYNDWEPRRVGKVTYEKGDPIMLGGMFAVWNDIAGNGISEIDAHNRVFPALQILAEKMWSASDENIALFDFNKKSTLLNEAPGMNMRGVYLSENPILLDYEFEDNLVNKGSLNQGLVKSQGVSYKEGKSGKALSFSTHESSLNPAIPFVGGNYTISFWIKPEIDLLGDLFTSKNATVFATENGVAYKRDGYVYEVGNLFPTNQWSFISITGDEKGVQFYRNGKLFKEMNPEKIVLPEKEKNGKEISYTKVKTLQFPLEKITLPSALLDNLKVHNVKMSSQDVLSEYMTK